MSELCYTGGGSPPLQPSSQMAQYLNLLTLSQHILPSEACIHTIPFASLKGVKQLFQKKEYISAETRSYLVFPL